jgi:hypothetical protein
VRLPIPAKLSWGVAPYDPYTRSELQAKALGSLFDLQDIAPPDHDRRWVDTRGWLLFFSLHGGEASQGEARP